MPECINEGPDKRLLRGLTCRLQGWLSFRSQSPPKKILETGSVFIGWPPVLAINIRHDSDAPKADPGGHKYLHVRLGWRWDAHPASEPDRGGWYILSAALKDLDHKLMFWRDPAPQAAREGQ